MVIRVLLTVVAADRSGLVEQIAEAVAKEGGSWSGSRMCRLGGQFAGIVEAEIPADALPAFRETMDSMRLAGIRVDCAEMGPADAPTGSWEPVIIEVVANDRPGIVRQISACLARLGVNVEDFVTECVSAPMTGDPLFRARAIVRPPAGCEAHAIREALEAAGEDWMVEVAAQVPK